MGDTPPLPSTSEDRQEATGQAPRRPPGTEGPGRAKKKVEGLEASRHPTLGDPTGENPKD